MANTCDLPAAWDAGLANPRLGEIHTVSAETGEGLDVLVAAIASHLVSEPPSPGAAVPFRKDHRQGLIRARAYLAAGDRAGFVHSIVGIGVCTTLG